MGEARVVVNLKEGIIELQGPVDFVRRYLDTYHFAIKGPQNLPKDIAASEQKAKASPLQKKRSAPQQS